VSVIGFAAIIALNRKRAARTITQLGLIPLIAGCGFQILFYAGQGYAATKEWYWVAQIIAVVLADCIVIDLLIKRVRREKFAPIAINLFVATIGLGLALGFGRHVIVKMPYQPIAAPYIDILPLLEDHTAPGSLIGMTGGGNIGYYIKDRAIINMDGLINSPAYFAALQAGESGAYLEALGLDYVFANPEILTGSLPYSRQFKNYYFEPIGGFTYGNKKLLRFVPLQR
jgi:hypothetical protein